MRGANFSGNLTIMDEDSLLIAKAALDEALTKCSHNQAALARLVGVQPQSVQQWFAQGFVSLKSTRAVADALAIPDWRLRPDHYLAPENQVAA